MVMFVLWKDGSDFINFNIEPQKFKKGEVIEHERLEGKHEVIHCDPVTVTVKPVE
ncbi:hypothetical protein Q7A53_05750 [Halobacillus rhizosphaerae]|uniref:hypothetical protein n=1 Tax=Halobacillus rhizosphaerae TaxID=3064889 RepID=UPI00398A7CDD